MSNAWAVKDETNIASVARPLRAPVLRIYDDGDAERRNGRQEPTQRPARRAVSSARESGPRHEAIVAIVRCYVAAHIGRQIGLDEIIAATGVSGSTVRRAVLAETGAQLAQFILRIRLDQAHAWLSTNRESRRVAQIAAALGFASAVTFGRSYQRRFGESPTETRKRAVRDAELPPER